MKVILFLLFVLPVVTNMACKKEVIKDDSLVQYKMTSVSGPNTALLNQVVMITVSYPYSNGCQVVDTFKEESSGTIIIIKAFGHYDKNAICTQDAGIRSKTFSYTPTSKGTFELRFTNTDGSFISHTITVN